MQGQFTPQQGLPSFDTRLEGNGEDSSYSGSLSFPYVGSMAIGQSTNKSRPFRRLPVRIPMTLRNSSVQAAQRTPSITEHPRRTNDSESGDDDSTPLMAMPDSDTFPFSHNSSGNTVPADMSMTQPQTKAHQTHTTGNPHHQFSWLLESGRKNRQLMRQQEVAHNRHHQTPAKAAPYPAHFTPHNKPTVFGKEGGNSGSVYKVGVAASPVFSMGRKPASSVLKAPTPHKAPTPRKAPTSHKAPTPRKAATPLRNSLCVGNNVAYFSTTKTSKSVCNTGTVFSSSSKKSLYVTPLRTQQEDMSCRRAAGQPRGKVLQDVHLNREDMSFTPATKPPPGRRTAEEDKENDVGLCGREEMKPLNLKVVREADVVWTPSQDKEVTTYVDGHFDEAEEEPSVGETEKENAANPTTAIKTQSLAPHKLVSVQEKFAPLIPAAPSPPCEPVISPPYPAVTSASVSHTPKPSLPATQPVNIPYIPNPSTQKQSLPNPAAQQLHSANSFKPNPSANHPSPPEHFTHHPSALNPSSQQRSALGPCVPQPTAPEAVKPPPPAGSTSPPIEDIQFCVPAAQPAVRPAASRSLLVNGKSYAVVGQLGKGGSSVVYQVMDPTSRMLAVKVVTLGGLDRDTAQGYLNEISFLRKLQKCENVIQLIDYEYVKKSQTLLVVMEKGDTDLSHLLKDIGKTQKISPLAIAYYWSEMVNAVKTIHEHGIIHSDLKPANFLLVSGRLKLIDFGIASAINKDMTSVVKEQIVGTFNYMSPEGVSAGMGKQQCGQKISFKSDVWSLGCILYNLVYGRPPFAHIVMCMAKLVAINDPHHVIPYPPGAPPALLATMQRCLTYAPAARPTAAQLLQPPLLPRLEDPTLEQRVKAVVSPEVWRAIVDQPS